MSGFTALLPRKLFTQETHTLRIVARDTLGRTQERCLKVAVAPGEDDDARGAARLRPQAEIDMKLRLIDAAGPPPVFAVLIAPGAEDGLAQTLDSLDAQAYRRFRVGALFACAELPLVEGELAAALDDERGFVLCLRAGDRLGADALLEFALEIVTRPEEDFLYADDRRTRARTRARRGVPEAGMVARSSAVDQLYRPRLVRRARVARPRASRRRRDRRARRLRSGAAADRGGAADRPHAADPGRGRRERRPRACEIAALRAAMRRRGVAGGVRATAAARRLSRCAGA